jgi:tRNA pseudouridine38-40 synthase
VIRKNIRLLIAYDGTNYSGWQRQQNGCTIQGVLEEKLSTITNTETMVNGAGRTDAGVHALGMTANFHTDSRMSGQDFQRALNSMLPTDIRILDASETAADFHARFDATSKTYRYDFFCGPVQPPTERLYRTHVRHPFNMDNVHPCLKFLIDSHDFTSFEARGSRDLSRTGGRGAVRTLLTAEGRVNPSRPQYYSFRFSGDGFLRHMVRNLVGALFLVGSGRMDQKEFQNVLHKKNRNLAGPTAPARGLFLEQVHYR